MCADVCMKVRFTLRELFTFTLVVNIYIIAKPVVQEAFNLFKFFCAETILTLSLFPPLMIVENDPDLIILVRLWTGFSVTCIQQETMMRNITQT